MAPIAPVSRVGRQDPWLAYQRIQDSYLETYNDESPFSEHDSQDYPHKEKEDPVLLSFFLDHVWMGESEF